MVAVVVVLVVVEVFVIASPPGRLDGAVFPERVVRFPFLAAESFDLRKDKSWESLTWRVEIKKKVLLLLLRLSRLL